MVQTGKRVGSARANINDETKPESTLAFSNGYSTPIDVWDAPRSVRAWGLGETERIFVQIATGRGVGTTFEDLWIGGRPVVLSSTNNLVVLTVDGTYRIRLGDVDPDDVTVVAIRTSAWASHDGLFAPSDPTGIPLYDAFDLRLGSIEDVGVLPIPLWDAFNEPLGSINYY